MRAWPVSDSPDGAPPINHLVQTNAQNTQFINLNQWKISYVWNIHRTMLCVMLLVWMNKKTAAYEVFCIKFAMITNDGNGNNSDNNGGDNDDDDKSLMLSSIYIYIYQLSNMWEL